MKTSVTLGVLGLCAFALSTSVEQEHYKVADKAFLEKQKEILLLFKYINQPSYYKEHIDIAASFKFDTYKSKFGKPEVFDAFLKFYNYGEFLPRGLIFSIFNYNHLQQVRVLFDMFYHAQDFETFYEFSVWARQHINEGMFLYTFSVALIHRPDTYGITLPPIYETYPYYFFSSEVIQKAQYYKQVYQGHAEQKEHHTIYANYSGYYLNLHPEQYMSYYLEDVGINTFYYYYNLYYPYWMSSEDYHFIHDKRGEMCYFTYQQILSRYYMERLSNDFGEIPSFNWQVPLETPYNPSLTYPNGLEFPSRQKFANLYDNFYTYGQRWTNKNNYGSSYTYVIEYDQRLHDALDLGYVFDKQGNKIDLFSKDGFNMVGNLIEGNPDSPLSKYYGHIGFFARHLLGFAFQPLNDHQIIPSALEHFETSLRDPAFYQFYKKIILYFQRYISYFPTYTEKDLYFPGVKVTNVEFDRLITYFDYFDSDISSAVYVTSEEFVGDQFKVYARQKRLNHKPFNYNIHVKSNKPVKASVKIFLGPKYDEYGRFINISENFFNFMEFDHFVYDLKAGENAIKRDSSQAKFFGPDRTSFDDLYKQIMGAYNGTMRFKIDGYQQYFYFPQRYMLPMGKEQGMPFQFFVYVYPYVEYADKHEAMGEYHYPKMGSGSFYIDNYPLRYPFNRFIQLEKIWYNMPNGYFYEAKIYHKSI